MKSNEKFNEKSYEKGTLAPLELPIEPTPEAGNPDREKEITEKNLIAHRY